MRERTSARAENANRTTRSMLALTTTTVFSTGLALLATPAGAAPGEATPPGPGGGITASAPVGATTSGAAATETQVREIDVPAPVSQGRGATAGGSTARSSHDGTDVPVVAELRRPSTVPFTLVGLTWRRGTAPEDVEVQVRTSSDSGWTAWQELHFHDDEGPAPSEEKQARDGTEPLWVGQADGVEARVLSDAGRAPADLEIALVDSGASGLAPVAANRSTATATTTAFARPTSASATTVASAQPRIVSRRQWGADPRLRGNCDSPRRANTLQMSFVHHTVGTNNYSRSESPSIVRGVYAYHTQGQGWCDIGYNFLVDRYGTVYEGRAGGINTAVRGAHAGDYNVRTAGVSLMGNFEKARPTRAMKRGVTRLLAWKLSSFYRYPKTRARISGSRFHKISGHRDAMSTACPGRYVYNWLPALRQRVAKRAGRISTPISRKWQRMRRNGANLGQPYRGEAGSAQGGRKTQFARGWIFWNERPGAHPVRGRIFRTYRRTGQAGGRLGYPKSDTWRIAGHRGRGQSFQRGRIYRTPGNGAVAVWGRINKRYAKAGYADGRLGVPTRTQYRVSGGWAADFERGRITWNTSSGRTSVSHFG